jgi:hypothetical protein
VGAFELIGRGQTSSASPARHHLSVGIRNRGHSELERRIEATPFRVDGT